MNGGGTAAVVPGPTESLELSRTDRGHPPSKNNASNPTAGRHATATRIAKTNKKQRQKTESEQVGNSRCVC